MVAGIQSPIFNPATPTAEPCNSIIGETRRPRLAYSRRQPRYVEGRSHRRFTLSKTSTATEGALETFVTDGAPALGTRCIRVYAVAPGIIETDMSNFTKIDAGRALAPHLQSMKRIGQPDDVSDVTAFLGSDGAHWITGASIPVDGGSTFDARKDLRTMERTKQERNKDLVLKALDTLFNLQDYSALSPGRFCISRSTKSKMRSTRLGKNSHVSKRGHSST